MSEQRQGRQRSLASASVHKSGGASVNEQRRQSIHASSGKGAAYKACAGKCLCKRVCVHEKSVAGPIAEADGHVSYERAQKQAGAKKQVH